jgi:hypothetical protein
MAHPQGFSILAAGTTALQTKRLELAMGVMKSIDIALGMIVVYLTFSLGVSAINEAVAAYFSSRAAWLRKGIAALLHPPAPGQAPAPGCANDFYSSPFISALGTTSGLSRRLDPSYIPPWTMLQGLLDSATGSKGQALHSMDAISKAVAQLPSGAPARVVLEDLLARAGADMEQFREGVEHWMEQFDHQVRAWYRQKTQTMLVLFSVVVAGVANLDTIEMFKHLSADSKTRSALVATALETAKLRDVEALLDTTALVAAKDKIAPAELNASKALGVLKAARAASDAEAPLAKPKEDAATASTQLQTAMELVQTERAKLEQAAADRITALTSDGMQFGWSARDSAEMAKNPRFWFILKAFGLLLSAAALSMGAPFWFDLLQKVASIRSVGLNLAERASKKHKAGATEGKP